MPAVAINNDNITSLDSKIVADLCGGNFLVDVTPSVFTAAGLLTSGGVQGASVRITNPVGVIFKNYPTSGYDIDLPMTAVVSTPIPLIASNYQYGNYTVDVRLTDDDGTEYTVTKTVNICPPDPNNKTRKQGCMEATINGNCDTGKVIISLKGTPNYKGLYSTSQVNSLEVDFPAASTPFTTTYGAFSLALFEGSWKVTGTVCALYSLGDNIYFKVQYKIKCEKVIRCAIDECCVQAKLDELRLKVKSDCTQEEKDTTFSTLLQGLALLKLAKITAKCGYDPSDIIGDMEDLLGCQCSCNCNDNTPIVNNDPVTDYRIEGCNVEEETVGLTKTYTINNYGYRVQLAEGSGAGLTLSEPVLNAGECEYVQTLEYTPPTIPNPQGFAYRGILNQAGTGAPTVVGIDSLNSRTIVWTRVSMGLYRGTVSGGGLTAANTFVVSQPTVKDSQLYAQYESANTITLMTVDSATGLVADDLLSNSSIQLTILS